MNTSKLLKGTIAGGIAFFLLGWVIYGMLLKDYSAAHMNTCMNRPDDGMIMWALALGNLVYALMLALVWDWANVSTASAGLTKGAILGVVMGLSWALMQYSMTTAYSDMAAVVVDILAGAVMMAITGAVTAWAMNMGE